MTLLTTLIITAFAASSSSVLALAFQPSLPDAALHPVRKVTEARPAFTASYPKVHHSPKTSSSLASFFGAPAEPDTDLVVGFATIAAACSPYTLSILLPDIFNDNFFLPIYNNETEALALAAREAEIGWKVRYTTLALALTTLAFAEVTWFPDEDPTSILRDSYYVWAIFYVLASLKIVREYQEGLLAQNRIFIQVWHILVAVILVADVSTGPRANALIDFIKDVFTFN